MAKYLGIDLGGTTIGSGIYERAQLQDVRSRKTPKTDQQDVLIDELVDVINLYKQQYKLDGIGLGAPGLVDSAGKFIYRAANVPLNKVDLGGILEERTGIKTFIDNDANLAALAEYGFGRLKGSTHGVVITLGTGIGAGAVLHGHLMRGFHGFAMELGHMTIHGEERRCNCGRKSCFETYASASRLVEYYNLGTEDKVSGTKEIFQRYKKDEKWAIEKVKEFTKYLAQGTANLIHLLDPEVIVFAGGLSGGFETIRDNFLKELNQELFMPEVLQVDFYVSSLDNHSGILGAGFMAEQRLSACRQ